MGACSISVASQETSIRYFQPSFKVSNDGQYIGNQYFLQDCTSFLYNKYIYWYFFISFHVSTFWKKTFSYATVQNCKDLNNRYFKKCPATLAALKVSENCKAAAEEKTFCCVVFIVVFFLRFVFLLIHLRV